MWILVYIIVYMDGMAVETWGKYPTYEQCMHDLKIEEGNGSFNNETLVCLQNPPDPMIKGDH